MATAIEQEGVSTRDNQQEWLARFGNPENTQIDGWFPISTAPRDGTPLQVRDGRWEPCHAKFIATDGGGYWKFLDDVSFSPTLWRSSP